MDVIDERILQALMLDGRASMRRIADAVGVSEQTAARRYRSMCDAGAVRVVVGPSAVVTRRRLWLLRLQCRPAAADRLGQVLADRDDVSWVALVSGGAELMCTTTLPADAACGTGVLPRLSNASSVLSFTAFSVLKSYSGGPAEWSGFDDPLSGTASRTVLADREPERRSGAGGAVTQDDLPLLSELRRDGRASIATLARSLGWPASRVAARLHTLVEDGSIVVDVDVLLEQFGQTASATLFLQVAPNRILEVCDALSAHRLTSWVAAVTGSANVVAAVTCRNSDALFAYVTEQVGPLPGVTHVEIIPVLQRLKQAETRVVEGRLARA